MKTYGNPYVNLEMVKLFSTFLWDIMNRIGMCLHFLSVFWKTLLKNKNPPPHQKHHQGFLKTANLFLDSFMTVPVFNFPD